MAANHAAAETLLRPSATTDVGAERATKGRMVIVFKKKRPGAVDVA